MTYRFKTLYKVIAVLGVLIASPSSAHATVNIFACTPEWAALAEDIGGAHIKVKAATTAQQDVHHIRAKPSLLAAMRQADLVFCTGASLEIGWLPILVKKAGGPNVQPETEGWLMAADYVEKLGMMEHADRSMGHVHPEGNPHIHLNPHNILTIAEVLSTRLALIDPDHRADYQANLARFSDAWDKNIVTWQKQGAMLNGQKFVVYHNAWAYLLQWLNMDAAASLEPKPGIPPSAAHLEKLLTTLKGQNVRAIIVTPYENRKAAEWLSTRLNIPILDLPFTVGGNTEATNLTRLFDVTLGALTAQKVHKNE